MAMMNNAAHVLQGQTTAHILDSQINFRRWRKKDTQPTEEELKPVREEQGAFVNLIQEADILKNVGKDKEKIGGLNVISAIDEHFNGNIPKKLNEFVSPLKSELERIDNYCRNVCATQGDCDNCKNPLEKVRQKEEQEKIKKSSS